MGQAAGSSVDFGYLEGFAAGDRTVIGEVLNLFLSSASGWAAGLTADNPGWRDLAHTIKGASRGIGANVLADAAARAEAEGPEGLPAVKSALEAARAEIAAYLARSA